LSENLDHIAARDFMAQRHHLAVHLGADALVPHFGVDHVSKIDGRGAARKFQHAAFRCKRVDFDRGKIHFQRGEKFSRLLEFPATIR